jgi:hypothetical protein
LFGAIPMNRKAPVESVIAVRSKPVTPFFACTVAPEIDAPEGSLTVPVIEPDDPDCGSAGNANASKQCGNSK